MKTARFVSPAEREMVFSEAGLAVQQERLMLENISLLYLNT
jgi:hypothetical protein